MNESLQVLCLFLLNPKLQVGLQGQGLQAEVASVPSRSSSWRTTALCPPLKAGLQLPRLRPLTWEEQPQWSYMAPSHTLKQKMKIRLMENKEFLGEKEKKKNAHE